MSGFQDGILSNWIRKPEPPPKHLCLSVSNTALATNVQASFTVPSDYDFHAENICVVCTAGAAQTITNMMIVVEPPATPVGTYLAFSGTVGVIGPMGLTCPNPITVQAGSKVVFAGNFSAGAANNAVQGNLHGYLIPRLQVLVA